MNDGVQLGIFAKHWLPGRVKTRLAATIGQVPAANIYHAFLTFMLEQFAGCGRQRTLVFSPDDAREAFAGLLGPAAGSWTLLAQGAGDLGARLERFFAAHCVRDQPLVVMGSDSPQIGPDVVTQAATALEDHDVVLGPSEDGGYYLLGTRTHIPTLFQGMPWSSANLLDVTIQQLQAAGISYALLSPAYDVDTEADLLRLEGDLRASPLAAYRRLADRIGQLRAEYEVN